MWYSPHALSSRSSTRPVSFFRPLTLREIPNRMPGSLDFLADFGLRFLLPILPWCHADRPVHNKGDRTWHTSCLRSRLPTQRKDNTMRVNLLRNLPGAPMPQSTDSAAANAVVRGLWIALALFCTWATVHLWPSVGSVAFLLAAIATICVGLFINLRER